MRKGVFIFLLLLFPVVLFAQSNNIIEVRVGNSIAPAIFKKGITANPDAYIHRFLIYIAPDGIIDRIDLLSNKDIEDPVNIKIKKANNSITIEKDNGDTINKIQWSKEKLSIVGPSFTRGSAIPVEVEIQPQKEIIYRSSEMILRFDANGLNEEFIKKPSSYFANHYKNGVLIVDYQRDGNVNYKYVFQEQPDRIMAKYYYPSGDDSFDEYSPPIEVVGKRLYAGNTRINVVNYLILRAANDLLSEVLFTSIFIPLNRTP